MGYLVYTATEAIQAVSAVLKNSSDIEVLDIFLPAGKTDSWLLKVSSDSQDLQRHRSSSLRPAKTPRIVSAPRHCKPLDSCRRPPTKQRWPMPSNRRCPRKTTGSHQLRRSEGNRAADWHRLVFKARHLDPRLRHNPRGNATTELKFLSLRGRNPSTAYQ